MRGRTLAFIFYLAVSFLYFGARLLPHPGRPLVGSGSDPEIFVWSFAWWEHAIATGTNPLVSHAVYAPQGINLAWTATVPGLAVPFVPLTAIAGPALAFNVAAVLMPALAAWTAFLLCRYLTGSFWASLAGGYAFGFSAYMLGQQTGHLHMTSVFLLPLLALVVIQYVRGDLGRRALAIRAGLIVGYQAWLSTELLVTTTLALAVALLLALSLVPAVRARVRSALAPLAAGYGLAAVIASPLVVYAVIGFRSESLNEPSLFNADLLNFVVPTNLVAATTSGMTAISRHFPGNRGEAGAYLGLPLLVVVGWYAIARRSSQGARFLVAALLLAMLAAVGTSLHVDGVRRLWLPWSLAARLPVLDNVLPVRFSVFAALTAAVILALFAAQRSVVRTVVALLVVASVIPALWRADFRMVPQRWPFFTAGTYKLCIERGENVAIFPYGVNGDSMLWQAETGFWFRMAGGYLIPKPPAKFIDGEPFVQVLTYTYDEPTYPELTAFAREKRVDRLVQAENYQTPPGWMIEKIGTPQFTGGMVVSPGCGYPPLKR